MTEEGRTDGRQAGGPSPAEAGESAAEAAPLTPEARLAALEAERNETKDRMLRVAAEFENWKKRARVTQAEAEATARESVLRDLLEVSDNLERATEAPVAGNGAPVDGAAVLKGVALVLRVLQQKLERHQVRPFEARGLPFDPRQHEAISRVESADVPAGSVAAELQTGYRIGDKLLRPALVSVSTGPGGAGGKASGSKTPDGGAAGGN